MKIFFSTLIMLSAMVIQANDAIKIINTVFHGINTVTNLARLPTVVVTPQSVVTPVITYPTSTSLVYPGETLYIVNGQYMILRNGVYIPYIYPTYSRYYHGPRRPNYHPPCHHRPSAKPSRAPPRKRR